MKVRDRQPARRHRSRWGENFPRKIFDCTGQGMRLQKGATKVWPLLWFASLIPDGADFPKIQHSVSRIFRVRKGYQTDPQTNSVLSVYEQTSQWFA